MKKRIISLLLAIVFVFLTIPIFTIPVSAASVVVSTADQLRAALMEKGDVTIVLNADITNYKLPTGFMWNSYDSDFETYYWAEVGRGKKTLYLQGHTVAIDDDFVTTAQYKRVKVYDESTGEYKDSRVFEKGEFKNNVGMIHISAGSELTVVANGGEMRMTCQVPSYNQIYSNDIICQRDVFGVNGGKLFVVGGTYQAGRTKNTYVTQSYEARIIETKYVVNKSENPSYYMGYGYFDINGTAVRVNDGDVEIAGGTFIGHGHTYSGKNAVTYTFRLFNNAVINAKGGNVSIYDAKVIGRSGADAIKIGDSAKVHIYSGEFITEANEKMLWPNKTTSNVYGDNSALYSNYMTIYITPGSSSVKGSELHNTSSITTYTNKRVVVPASSGFVSGNVKCVDFDTTEKFVYSINTSTFVKYEDGDTYFPPNTTGSQEYSYYWSLMEQKSDGKWAAVFEEWVKDSRSINLKNFYDGWKDGTEYRLTAKRVETWTSQEHYYEQTVKSSNTLYFTAANEQEIRRVTVTGFTQDLETVDANTLKSSTAGVKSVSSVWYDRLGSHTEPIDIKVGLYQAYVTIRADLGYVFNPNVTVEIGNEVFTPSYISKDRRAIEVLSPIINKPCDHSRNVNTYSHNTEQHYIICSVCGKSIYVGNHYYDNGVSVGTTTTYTCLVCDYETRIDNGKEALSSVVLDMPALVAGEKLTSPVISSDLNGKVKIKSYQWYKGKGTSNKVDVGSITESGWYTLEVTVDANGGYYFKNNAFVTHSHGSKAGASATDGTLTGTVNVYCNVAGDASIKIPSLTPDKTLETVIKGIETKRSGDERINVNYYIDVLEKRYIVKRSFDGNYTLGGGDATSLEELFNTKILPRETYEIEVEFSTGTYYVSPDDITVESESYMLDYVCFNSDEWSSVKATITSETDIIDTIRIDNVTEPVAGEAPVLEFRYSDPQRMYGTGVEWNTQSDFECGKSYSISCTLAPVDGYRLDLVSNATINGYDAEIIVNGTTVTVSFEFPVLEHNYEDENVIKEATCTEDGEVEYTCKVCGEKKTDTIPANGHDFVYFEATLSTCHTNGTAEHYKCHSCDKVFDKDKNEISEESVILPLNPQAHEGGDIHCDELDHYVLCVCGEKLEIERHTFGEEEVVREAEPGLEGIVSKECQVCGYIEFKYVDSLPGKHVHEYVMKHDGTYHWQECKCGDIIRKEEHYFGSDDVCDVCQYGNELIEEYETTPNNGQGEPNNKKSLLWLWILIAVLVIGAVCVVIFVVAKKKPQQEGTGETTEDGGETTENNVEAPAENAEAQEETTEVKEENTDPNA